MKDYKKLITAPNIMTFIRIICAICLIFVEPLSTVFMVLYLVCGLSDALDGFVARMTKTTSEFGAKLDSIADIMFYSIVVVRFFPMLLVSVSGNIWFVVNLIVLVRVGIYLTFALRHKTLVSTHTYLNKLTGFLVFCLPFVINTKVFGSYSVAVCIVALCATIYELTLCFKGKKASSEETAA